MPAAHYAMSAAHYDMSAAQADMPLVTIAPAESCWSVGGLARGYYRNDQRIEWSGMEESFGAEGVIAPAFRRQFGAWETRVEGEFYLNQPFDRNILADTPERVSYQGNFHVDTFEISQLWISCAATTSA